MKFMSRERTIMPSAPFERPPICFPDIQLQLIKLTPEQIEEIRNTGWLREAIFKTKPSTTKVSGVQAVGVQQTCSAPKLISDARAVWGGRPMACLVVTVHSYTVLQSRPSMHAIRMHAIRMHAIRDSSELIVMSESKAGYHNRLRDRSLIV